MLGMGVVAIVAFGYVFYQWNIYGIKDYFSDLGGTGGGTAGGGAPGGDVAGGSNPQSSVSSRSQSPDITIGDIGTHAWNEQGGTSNSPSSSTGSTTPTGNPSIPSHLADTHNPKSPGFNYDDYFKNPTASAGDPSTPTSTQNPFGFPRHTAQEPIQTDYPFARHPVAHTPTNTGFTTHPDSPMNTSSSTFDKGKWKKWLKKNWKLELHLILGRIGYSPNCCQQYQLEGCHRNTNLAYSLQYRFT